MIIIKNDLQVKCPGWDYQQIHSLVGTNYKSCPEDELSLVRVLSFQRSCQSMRCVPHPLQLKLVVLWCLQNRSESKGGISPKFQWTPEQGRKGRPCFPAYKQGKQELCKQRHGSLFYPLLICRTRLVQLISQDPANTVCLTDDFSPSSGENVSQTLNRDFDLRLQDWTQPPVDLIKCHLLPHSYFVLCVK